MRALLTHAWPSLLATLLVAALAGCHDEKAIETPVSKTTPTVATLVSKSCSATQPGVFAARPFGNKTKAAVELGGTEDLVMTAMTESGCYKVAERDQVDILIEEMKRCSDDNPDKQYFKCDDFAKKGKLMGVIRPNVLVLTMQPNEGVSLSLGAKIPGSRMRIRPVNMEFQYGTAFMSRTPEAYERLLLDAMRGDATLFTRRDEVEEQWAYMDRVFDAWRANHAIPPPAYPAGSWGPDAADALLARDGRRWRRP